MSDIKNEWEGTVRKYSDPKERTIKVNQTALISNTIIEVVLVFALFAQSLAMETSYGKLGLVPAIILFVGIIINWIVYKKDRSNEKLRYIMLTSFAVGWTYIMVSGENAMVTFYIYPILISTLLYHDKKFEKI